MSGSEWRDLLKYCGLHEDDLSSEFQTFQSTRLISKFTSLFQDIIYINLPQCTGNDVFIRTAHNEWDQVLCRGNKYVTFAHCNGNIILQHTTFCGMNNQHIIIYFYTFVWSLSASCFALIYQIKKTQQKCHQNILHLEMSTVLHEVWQKSTQWIILQKDMH